MAYLAEPSFRYFDLQANAFPIACQHKSNVDSIQSHLLVAHIELVMRHSE